jgi:NTE family protein
VGDVGLVLTGGGARAAYQVGAVQALADLLPGPVPFRILSGVSAGAVNAVFLAGQSDEFAAAAERLKETWLALTPDRVYRTDARRLTVIGARWMRDLSSGGLFGRNRINFLLDASPLRDLLAEVLPVSRIPKHIESGRLRGVAVTATSYATNMAVTFFDGPPDVEPWLRSTRLGLRDTLKLDHVMASAAIPIFFPPVRIRGAFYGDGCVRMTAPLSPAIHMGAERLVAISVRAGQPEDQGPRRQRRETLAPSEIAGVLMNAVFLDSVEADVERLESINRTLALIPPEGRRAALPLRPVPVLLLKPSQDLGMLAQDQHKRFPRMLRYLLRGIGANANNGSDLLSYLAFEPVYVSRLFELGYQDTLARRKEIEAFLGERGDRAAAGPRAERPRAEVARRGA